MDLLLDVRDLVEGPADGVKTVLVAGARLGLGAEMKAEAEDPLDDIEVRLAEHIHIKQELDIPSI